jgi:hypothetical protein
MRNKLNLSDLQEKTTRFSNFTGLRRLHCHRPACHHFLSQFKCFEFHLYPLGHHPVPTRYCPHLPVKDRFRSFEASFGPQISKSLKL